MADIKMIPIGKIIPDKDQPRKVFNIKELEDLASSIQKEGQMQPLILESNYDGDKFLILDGERRYRANLFLKSEKVPATIMTGPLSLERRAEIRFNVQEQHASWNDIDKAKAIFEYKRSSGLTLQEVADKLNLHLPKVHAYLSIVDFSETAQNLIAENNIQFSYLTYAIRIVKSYMALTEKFTREEIETFILNKIANNIFRTVPEIQNFSKTVQSESDVQIKLDFLTIPEMTYFEYIESLKMDAKEFTVKLQKVLQNLNFELKKAKDKNFRLYDEQFAVFEEIQNKMNEFASVQAIEQNKDEDAFDGF
jgi:ParB family chromosome partitioning protein